mgnify:CR=1 FL=1
MYPVGRTGFGRAVAAAMKSPLTMGPGRFHHSVIREEVDTVYLGAMRREWFGTLGGFRAFASGTSEDADIYFNGVRIASQMKAWGFMVSPDKNRLLFSPGSAGPRACR